MPSKLVTDRQKSARAVAAAANTHGASVGEALKGLLAPHLQGGEQMPDVGLLCLLVGRLLLSQNEKLVAADAAHEAELNDDGAPREARDRAAFEVRRVLVDLRATVAAVHGSAGLKQLGLTGATPEDPSVLAVEGAAVLTSLEDASISLPAPRRGTSLNRQDFADELREHLAPLQSALATVSREAREAETTLAAKQAAMTANDRAFSLGAAWLTATFSLAGREDLAARVRPSVRRPGQTEAEETPAPTP
jgi:hypothetical protein